MTTNTNNVKPDPMPRFVLLGKDKHTPETILAYAHACDRAGNHAQHDEAVKAYYEMLEWQQRNPDKVKEPDHKHVDAR